MRRIEIGPDERGMELLEDIRTALHESNRLHARANIALGDALEMNKRSKRLLVELVKKIRRASGLHIRVADDDTDGP